MIYTAELGVGDEQVIDAEDAPTTVHVYWNGVSWVISEHGKVEQD